VLKTYHPVRIEWGDCDAAAITFYPNYFAWFDASSWNLFESAGYTAGPLMRDHKIYLPLVEAEAKFKRPGFLGDRLLVESFVEDWREKVFRVKHTVRRGDDILLEGSELRCWATPHPDDPQRFQARSISSEFREALEGK